MTRFPGAQHFCSTSETLEMGMCGGPVFGSDGKCVGIVEGTVPAGDHPLAAHAAIITAPALLPLLDRAKQALRDLFYVMLC